MAFRAMRLGLMSRSEVGPVIVQTATIEDGTVTLTGVTVGNIIVGIASSDDSIANDGQVSHTGFDADLFQRESRTCSLAFKIGPATATTVTFDLDRNRTVAMLAEIAGVQASGLSSTIASEGTDSTARAPALSGFAAGDLAVSACTTHDASAEDVNNAGTSPPSGYTLLMEEYHADGSNKTFCRAVFKIVDSAGTVGEISDFFGVGEMSRHSVAMTARIPVAA